jgi:hypothetical protein
MNARRMRGIAIAIVAALAMLPAAAVGQEDRARESQHQERGDSFALFATITASAKVKGLPERYVMEFLATAAGDGLGDLRVTLRRGGPREREYHAFSVLAGVGDGSCNDAGDRCSIDIGDTLGDRGRLDLTFRSTQAPRYRNLVCPSTGEVYGREQIHKGKLRGVLRFDTGANYFGTLGNRSGADSRVPVVIKAKATETQYTGDCLPDCRSLRLLVSSGPFDFVGAAREGDTTEVQMGRFGFPPSNSEPVSEAHYLQFQRPADALRDTSPSDQPLSAATLDLGTTDSRLSGSLTFAAAGRPQSTPGEDCQLTEQPGTVTGSVTATFDGYPELTIIGGDIVTLDSWRPTT